MGTPALARSSLLVLALGAFEAAACGLVAQDGGAPPGSGGSGSGGAGTGGTFGYPACERLPGQNEGATSGQLFVRGQALTPDGVPVPNLRVTLADAVHYTSLYGTYALRVDSGTHELELGDEACLAEPASTTVPLADESVTIDAESAGGACGTTTPLEAWWGGGNFGVDDPSRQSAAAASDWVTSAYLQQPGSPTEFIDYHLANAEEGSICTFLVGHIVGFESRTVVSSEAGEAYTSLDTLFLQGNYVFLFRTPVAVDAADDEIARRLVPVRNLTEADLWPPPQIE
jgi:hypothetical protein